MAAVSLFGLLQFADSRARKLFEKGHEHGLLQGLVFTAVTATLLALRNVGSMQLLLADRYLPDGGGLEAFLLGLWAVWVAGRLLNAHNNRKQWAQTRSLVWGLFSVVFFTQLALGLLGLDRMLMTGTLHLPVPALIFAGPLYRGSGFFMFFLFLFTVAAVGPAWCSWLCYIGAWDDKMSRVMPRTMKSRRELPAWTKWSRPAILVLVLATAWILRVHTGSTILAVTLAAAFGLVGVGVMVFVSRKMGVMVHCTTYCPIGIVGNVLGKCSPWRLKMGDSCTKCGICSTACRYGALRPENIDKGAPGLSCTLCGDCVHTCPHDSLAYKLPYLSSGVSRAVFIFVVTWLHAVFLGVARM